MPKKFFDFLKPPEHWRMPVLLTAGILVGLGCYVFYVSRAHSYLSDEPTTCVNCHIMAPQYATWSHSAHREVATCNDCHVPHNNVFNTYYFKAKDGMRHASVFTMRAEPQVIFIKEEGQKVVQQNCVRCHEYLITDDKLLAQVPDMHQNIDDRYCWECHRETPHGRVNSLSSVPHARVPVPESPLPDWLKKLNQK
ncbi:MULTISPECIES: cytochrome c nitrite reductase small subunit [unclassified Carboxylicivirga]|uniref:cytochrome c nitrite reductase small subunit n=1 Tax=Carboxylicivirga TaxID=1628153 RepID=UPI003D32F185